MAQKEKQPRFIVDEAKDRDLIGTLNPVAKSLATIVRSNSNLKIIGLLGSWGSGKSTVLKILEKDLRGQDGDRADISFFLYDAWLHQNDPPRRSFLETLIKFLASKNLTREKDWSADVDRLRQRLEESDSRTTPTLTPAGKSVGFALLLFPVGLHFVGHEWLGKTFGLFGFTVEVFHLGIAFLLAPIFAAFLVYLVWRQTWKIYSAKFWTRSNWTSHKHPHSEDSIFSLFVNKTVDHIRNRTIRTPDPTSIEFQELYSRLMSTVSSNNRKYVFVIDNLDRISEAEALTLWSTIRGFFIQDSRVGGQVTESTAPTVILPLDPGSIKRMFGKDHPDENLADELAQSFIDKTFDITFQVSPPVLSDWQGYLGQQFRFAFQDLLTESELDLEAYHVTRLYESNLAAKSKPAIVTPRTLIRLINAIAALRLQWGNAIAFPSLAYYVINKGQIDKNLLEVVAGEDLVLGSIDPQWKASVVALYYGTPVDKAIQVLMEADLLPAISNADVEKFVKLSRVPGFATNLQKIVEARCNVAQPEPEFVSNAASLIAEASISQDQPRIGSVERSLRSAIKKSMSWKSLPSSSAKGIAALISSSPTNELNDFVTEVAVSIQRASQELLSSKDFIDGWFGMAETIYTSARKRESKLPAFTVPGGPGPFLRTIVKAKNNPEFLRLIRPDDVNSVTVAFATEASGKNFGPEIHDTLNALLQSNVNWTWMPLVNAAGQYVQSHGIDDTAMYGALRALGLLRRDAKTGASTEIAKLFQEGYLFDKLYEAHHQKKLKAEAAIVALLALENPKLTRGAIVGNMEAGYQLATNIDASLKDRPEILSLIDAELRDYGDLKRVVDAAQASNAMRPLLQKVTATRMQGGQIGALDVGDVLSRLHAYLVLLEGAEKSGFILSLPNHDGFWEKLSGLSLDADSFLLFDVLIDQQNELGARARAELADRLKALPQDRWQETLQSGAQPLPLALKLVGAEDQLDFGEPLLSALDAVVDEALGGKSFDPGLVSHWFKLSDALGKNSRGIFFKGVRDRMISTSRSGSLAILSGGGGTLLSEGQFQSYPDQAARQIVKPMLDINPAGLDWLKANSAEISSWIRQAESDTRGYIAERLAEFGRQDDEGLKSAASALGTSWNLSSEIVEASASVEKKNESEKPKEPPKTK